MTFATLIGAVVIWHFALRESDRSHAEARAHKVPDAILDEARVQATELERRFGAGVFMGSEHDRRTAAAYKALADQREVADACPIEASVGIPGGYTRDVGSNAVPPCQGNECAEIAALDADAHRVLVKLKARREAGQYAVLSISPTDTEGPRQAETRRAAEANFNRCGRERAASHLKIAERAVAGFTRLVALTCTSDAAAACRFSRIGEASQTEPVTCCADARDSLAQISSLRDEILAFARATGADSSSGQ